jgi:hypothetical protein
MPTILAGRDLLSLLLFLCIGALGHKESSRVREMVPLIVQTGCVVAQQS